MEGHTCLIRTNGFFDWYCDLYSLQQLWEHFVETEHSILHIGVGNSSTLVIRLTMNRVSHTVEKVISFNICHYLQSCLKKCEQRGTRSKHASTSQMLSSPR